MQLTVTNHKSVLMDSNNCKLLVLQIENDHAHYIFHVYHS